MSFFAAGLPFAGLELRFVEARRVRFFLKPMALIGVARFVRFFRLRFFRAPGFFPPHSGHGFACKVAFAQFIITAFPCCPCGTSRYRRS